MRRLNERQHNSEARLHVLCPVGSLPSRQLPAPRVRSTSYFTQLTVQHQVDSLARDCFPVMVPGKPYIHRCLPVVPDNVIQGLTNLTNSSLASTDGSDSSLLRSKFGKATLAGVAALHNVIAGGMNNVSQYVNDLAKGWLILFIGGFLASAIVALAWLTLLRYAAGFMARRATPLVAAPFPRFRPEIPS